MGNSNASGPVRSENGFVNLGGSNLSLGSPTTITTAGVETYTVAQFKTGLLLRDPNGAGRADVTPTAALIVAGFADCNVGFSFDVHIRNTADGAETITLTAGTGVTISGTATIAQNNAKTFRFVVTNNAIGSQAVTAYSLGTVVF